MFERLRAIAGPDVAVNGDQARAFGIDGLTPSCLVSPASVGELRRCVAAIAEAGGILVPVGNGSRLAVGRAPHRYDVALSTRRLRRVLAHAAGDMTVSVEAGLTLAELNTRLEAAGQHLPLDPPHPERTTIGGLIATAASGPLRYSQGTVRDLLIGITVVLADGTMVKGGGRVVKNVAGYDLMKLFTGSHGTLGIVVDATFKVRPLPAHVASIVVPCPTTAAAAATALALLSAPLSPSSLEMVNTAAACLCRLDGPAVVIGCAGREEEVAVQVDRVRAHCADRDVLVFDDAAGERLRIAVRDWPADSGGNAVLGCRLSLLPSRLPEVLPQLEDAAARHGWTPALLAYAGNGVAVLRVDGTTAAPEPAPHLAEAIRTTVRRAGGWTVFDLIPSGFKDRIDPWGTDIPGLALMRGVKRTLDPHARLSPGRFVGGI